MKILSFNEFVNERYGSNDFSFTKKELSGTVDVKKMFDDILSVYAKRELNILDTQKQQEWIDGIYNEFITNYESNEHKEYNNIQDVTYSFNGSCADNREVGGHKDDCDIEVYDVDTSIIESDIDEYIPDREVVEFLEDHIQEWVQEYLVSNAIEHFQEYGDRREEQMRPEEI